MFDGGCDTGDAKRKTEFPHMYALLEFLSKDNSLASRGSVSLRNERFYRGYRDRAGRPHSCIITPLLSDGLLYTATSRVCKECTATSVCILVSTTKERLRNYSLPRCSSPSIKTVGVSGFFGRAISDRLQEYGATISANRLTICRSPNSRIYMGTGARI